MGLSGLDLVLVAVFRLAFGSQGLDFLVWNIFLAWIPLIAALALDDVRTTPLALNFPLLGFWLAFFPNAPYLVTDLVHLNDFGHGPAGAIAVVALIAAVPTGLALGFSSLLLVERSMRDRLGPRVALAISVASLVTACVGIYLGRVLRLNTWDLLSRPRFQVRPPSVERTTPSSRVPAQSVPGRCGWTASDSTVSRTGSPRRVHVCPRLLER